MHCEHFGRCGGCTYLDISYEEELAVKKEALVECLGEYGHLVGNLHPSPVRTGYRNKMEFAFGDEGKDGLLALGIRKKRSFYEVATPSDCVLIPEDFKIIVRYVIEHFRETGETFFHRKRHTGALRHLVLRRGEFTGEILVMLSAASTLKAPLEPFVSGLLSLPLGGKIVGILHSVNDGVADAVKNENTSLIHGRDFYNEEICGLKFKVSAFSFFQTNSKGAEVLYKIVRDFAAGEPDGENFGGSLAYDLYCGTGTIAQIISPVFRKVLGVELIEDAILAARENAAANNITNCEFHAGDAFAILAAQPAAGSESSESFESFESSESFEFSESPEEREFPESQIPVLPEVIVVDPPRDGLHPKALSKIAEIAAPRIVYVACKPKSLARDMPVLIEAGYTPVKTEAVDMFPYTPHVEAIALLRRQDTGVSL